MNELKPTGKRLTRGLETRPTQGLNSISSILPPLVCTSLYLTDDLQWSWAEREKERRGRSTGAVGEGRVESRRGKSGR